MFTAAAVQAVQRRGVAQVFRRHQAAAAAYNHSNSSSSNSSSNNNPNSSGSGNHNRVGSSSNHRIPNGTTWNQLSSSSSMTSSMHTNGTTWQQTLSPSVSSPRRRFFSSTTATPSPFLDLYQQHVEERMEEAGGQGIVPKPLDASQVGILIDELKAQEDASDASARELLELLIHRVPPGVDEAAYVKAGWLSALATGKEVSPHVSQIRATELLGTMQGGYNVGTLVELLQSDDEQVSSTAAEQLKHTLLMFDATYDVINLHEKGCKPATDVLESWANAEWFTSKPAVPEKITVTVFKVTGETNTDDLSPAPDAWSRPDSPLHAVAMLKNQRDGIEPDADGTIGPIQQMSELQAAKGGHKFAYVGDVVGTGSSRKSATNSVLWYMGEDLPYVPNIRGGGLCLGGKIAPIFFNTMEDSGALPIELDVSKLNMGDVIDVFPHQGVVKTHGTEDQLCDFQLKTPVILDEVRAGGRIPLINGRVITTKAREALGREIDLTDVFQMPAVPEKDPNVGFTLGQKMVGKACGLPAGQGVLPDSYCEPMMTTVGSQDTTGPMTRDELRSLACLGFSADLVMQSFCHTAAYPKPVDVVTHHTLPDFIQTRGGVSLRPGDGIIHSWLNRMLLPDTVGTGGDSHTRFPIGISFPLKKQLD